MDWSLILLAGALLGLLGAAIASALAWRQRQRARALALLQDALRLLGGVMGASGTPSRLEGLENGDIVIRVGHPDQERPLRLPLESVLQVMQEDPDRRLERLRWLVADAERRAAPRRA